MLNLPASLRIFVSSQPVDCRKSFTGLIALVRHELGGDPLSGHLFLFRNKRADRLKILYWDRDGYAIWYKRLEEGVYRIPLTDAKVLEITPAELTMLLEGIDWSRVQRSHRYRQPAASTASLPA